MGGRLPPYNLNGSNNNDNTLNIVSPLHDLNTVDSRGGDMDMDGIATTGRSHQDGHPGDTMDHEEENDSVVLLMNSSCHVSFCLSFGMSSLFAFRLMLQNILSHMFKNSIIKQKSATYWQKLKQVVEFSVFLPW